MAQKDPGAMLTRSLLVLADSLVIARRRCGDAAAWAETVDAATEQQLLDVYRALQSIEAGVSESLAELQNPPTGP